MNIYKIVNPIAVENTYILENDNSLLVIDPGSDGQKVLSKIIELEKPVVAILLTHTHYDHIMSLDLVRETFNNPPVYVAEAEASWLESPEDNLSGMPRHAELPNVIAKPADFYFQYDEIYDLEGFHFKVVPTPGHSIGGVSFIFSESELVITGDALFKETIGRTDLPTGNLDQLLECIKNQLFTLPNHFSVYPGHGMNTTIAHEKNFNPYFQN
ncbi:hypothetical protein HMPREF9318_00710 [Streptococcus urinalis FB127-CNA-2]|uniref:Metallo-beta-lactamase domain protein n=1 Tax=Streptococcus urinalis 2285-97 TaxID=764291 RepID=G5KHF5_9STRE|nr:MBL fold metallo-hydrolase [Streptococcus urinalis]EHJ55707.1 metallo-beta-lactamase domain protein [Streptococcus urinalis 2285-97]EKS22512.1 hypothetical protein HMPREF9318_00710 [Streptococcus urinalis FB127-CNA-2]VEF32325.1 Hydroxyacylglutathione hydrolase [Streptococcus urinalis]